MACPLCSHEYSRASWVGTTFYRGLEYPYVQCLSCGSLYADPMPGAETLAEMYGPAYATSFADDPSVDDPKELGRVIRWLEKAGGGIFIDYGCGAGRLLMEASKLPAWHAIGVEIDEKVASSVEHLTGMKVTSRPAELADGPPADVLHVGDVLEHLTEIDRLMPELLKLIRPGGLLLAQGPLENNASLFASILRFWKWVHPGRRTEMAPYHVMLATAAGQRRLFQRYALEELEYSIDEVAWPAPSRLTLADLTRPRSVTLFLVRRLSRMISTLRPARWGNRYFYAGRWNG